MTKDLTPQDFLDCGYKKFTDYLKSSSYGLQKKFTDSLGVMYFITVYVYENKDKPWWDTHKEYRSEFSFSPDLQFNRAGIEKPTLDIHVFMERDSTVAWLEEEVYDLWLTIEADYYELY